jgi:hypothetical protein
MIVAVLLLVCLVLAGVVAALSVLVLLLRRVEARLATVEQRAAPRAAWEARQESPPDPTPVERVESRDDAPEMSDFVITRLGDPEPEPVPTLEARLFADVVLRETVVKAASWTYGVRRGLSPANRNRIWFEMRREVRRARKARKAEEREAIREYRARRRADVRSVRREESAA